MKILCHECGASCSTESSKKFIIRAYVICGDCMGRVPEYLWQQVIKVIHSDGSNRFIETPDEKLPITQQVIEEAAKAMRLQQVGIDALAPKTVSVEELDEKFSPPPYSAPFTGPPSGPDDSDREPTVEQELKELAKTQRTHHGKLTPITSKQLFADEIDALTPADRAEYRKFERYLKCRAKYGMKVLVGRPYWRKYFGLE